MQHSGTKKRVEAERIQVGRKCGMRFERAKPFSNGTEYEIFRYNYCENGCIHHIDREDGFPELLENGGCPIEDGMECARYNREMFPNVLLEAWDGEKQYMWHHCPFYAKEKGESDENTVR